MSRYCSTTQYTTFMMRPASRTNLDGRGAKERAWQKRMKILVEETGRLGAREAATQDTRHPSRAMAGYHARARVVRNVHRNRTLKHLFFTSGIHHWEVDVVRMDKRAAIVVGAVPSELFDGETLNGPLASWTNGAVGYAAYGAIIQNGKEVETNVQPFHAGDVVGVQLDLNACTIAFYLNGFEVARWDGDGHSTPRHPLALDGAAVGPISFASRAMFAAVTFAPDTDDFDVYSTPVLPR